MGRTNKEKIVSETTSLKNGKSEAGPCRRDFEGIGAVISARFSLSRCLVSSSYFFFTSPKLCTTGSPAETAAGRSAKNRQQQAGALWSNLCETVSSLQLRGESVQLLYFSFHFLLSMLVSRTLLFLPRVCRALLSLLCSDSRARQASPFSCGVTRQMLNESALLLHACDRSDLNQRLKIATGACHVVYALHPYHEVRTFSATETRL